MITELKKSKNCEAELTVRLEQKELKNYIQQAAKEFSQVMSMDGFRPGHIPLEAVRGKIGDQKLLETSLDLAVKESLAAALEEKKLEVIFTQDLKILKNSFQELEYRVRLLIFPEVKIKNYKHFNVSRRAVEVTEAETEETINRILKSRADYCETKEPAAKGHHLEIDFEVSHQGILIEGGKSENHPFVLGQGNFIPGFEDQLIGLCQGESWRFSLPVPSDYYQKSIAGKKLDFLVTVKSVKTVTPPTLNEQFVKTLGRFSSVAELRRSVMEGLKKEKEQKERERLQLEILEKIDGESEIDVPPQLAEQQLNLMIKNFDRELQTRGLELGLYLAQLKKTEQDLKNEWRKQAEKQIRRSLILREIGRLENIKVSQQEAEKAANILASQLLLREERGAEGENGRREVDLEGLRIRAYESLLNQKIFEYLEGVNVV